jgi:hypothetical protein
MKILKEEKSGTDLPVSIFYLKTQSFPQDLSRLEEFRCVPLDDTYHESIGIHERPNAAKMVTAYIHFQDFLGEKVVLDHCRF